jgi:uncharacterized protein (TIGR00730 family)
VTPVRSPGPEWIAVFCASSPGRSPSHRDAARDLGRLMAERGHGLVYGGGKVGLMGCLADAALAGGGRVVGVIPEALAAKEVAHTGLTRLHVVPTMHARKALMAELAQAFVALPGGFGTLEELFEVVTWAQLGIHRKPIALLNVDGYFDSLVALVGRAVGEGFVPEANRRLVGVFDEPLALLEGVARMRAPETRRWVTADET